LVAKNKLQKLSIIDAGELYEKENKSPDKCLLVGR